LVSVAGVGRPIIVGETTRGKTFGPKIGKKGLKKGVLGDFQKYTGRYAQRGVAYEDK